MVATAHVCRVIGNLEDARVGRRGGRCGGRYQRSQAAAFRFSQVNCEYDGAFKYHQLLNQAGGAGQVDEADPVLAAEGRDWSNEP